MHLLLQCWSRVSRAVRGGLLCTVLITTACRREEIQVYEASKDSPAPAAPMAAGMEPPPIAMPVLKWDKLPEGWQSRPLPEGPGRTRAASFQIEGAGGLSAELSVVAIPDMGNDDLEFVNMWRNQINLPPIEAGELGKYVESITVAGAAGKLFSMEGASAAQPDASKGSVLVALTVTDGISWFFKLSGTQPSVSAQKQIFLGFLKGVHFEAGQAHPPIASGGGPGGRAPARGARPSPSLPKWEVPAGWTAAEPGQMILAKFTAQNGGNSADITVSSFPGDVGGLLANVNRWRDQVGLPKLDEGGLASATQTIDLSEGKGTVVDVTGNDRKSGQTARLVGVIVPRAGQTWFYKLMGHPDVAEHEKAALIQFARSAHY